MTCGDQIIILYEEASIYQGSNNKKTNLIVAIFSIFACPVFIQPPGKLIGIEKHLYWGDFRCILYFKQDVQKTRKFVKLINFKQTLVEKHLLLRVAQYRTNFLQA